MGMESSRLCERFSRANGRRDASAGPLEQQACVLGVRRCAPGDAGDSRLLSSLSIGIACYNDAPTIETTIREAADVAGRIATQFQILVVDDGSKDHSPAMLRSLARNHSWIECRFHNRNLGFGATFGALYATKTCEYNAILAGDGQVPAAEIETLAAHVASHDLILGWRAERADSVRRQIGSRVYNEIVTLLLGKRVRDVNSVSLVRTAVTRDLVLRSRSAFIHAEYFFECLRRGVRFAEVPVKHRPRFHGRASGGKPSVAVAAIADLLVYALAGRVPRCGWRAEVAPYPRTAEGGKD